MSSSSSNNSSNCSSSSDKVEDLGSATATRHRSSEGRQQSPSLSSSASSTSSSPVPGPGQGERKREEEEEDGNEANDEKGSSSEAASTGEFAFTQYRDRAGPPTTHPPTSPGSASASVTGTTATTTSVSSTSTSSTLTPDTTSVFGSFSRSSNGATATTSPSNFEYLFATSSPNSVSSTAQVTTTSVASPGTAVTSSTSTPFVFGNGLFERAMNGQSSHSNEDGVSTTTFGSATASGGGGFVFGQNLLDRVVNQQTSTNDNEVNPVGFGQSTEQSNPVEASVLFGTAANSAGQASEPAHENEPPLSGEETERNVLNLTCKLYAYDSKSNNWVERGQGQLRLNDPKGGRDEVEGRRPRLIVRSVGTWRLVVNTQIWHGIDVKLSSEKCLRFLDQHMQIFTVKCGSIEDVTRLYKAIKLRVPPTPPEKIAPPPAVKNPTPDTEESSKGTIKRGIPDDDEENEDDESSLPEAPYKPSTSSITPSTSKKPHLEED